MPTQLDNVGHRCARGEFEANDGRMAQVRQECDDCGADKEFQNDVVLGLRREALRCELGLLPKRFLSAVSQLWVAWENHDEALLNSTHLSM